MNQECVYETIALVDNKRAQFLYQLLSYAHSKYGKENVIALSISYGQKHKKEVEAARSIAAYYGIELLSLDLQKIFTYSDCSLLEQSDAEVPKESYAEQLKETSGNLCPFP